MAVDDDDDDPRVTFELAAFHLFICIFFLQAKLLASAIRCAATGARVV
jgi:hypothetical protein